MVKMVYICPNLSYNFFQDLTLKCLAFRPNVNAWGVGAKSAPSIFLPNEWSYKKKLKLAFKIKVI